LLKIVAGENSETAEAVGGRGVLVILFIELLFGER